MGRLWSAIAIAISTICLQALLSNAECEMPATIIDRPEEAIDGLMYYRNPGDQLAGNTISGMPLNSILKPTRDLAEQLISKMESLYVNGGLGNTGAKVNGVPIGEARYFRGEYTLEGLRIVTSSFVKSKDQKSGQRIGVPLFVELGEQQVILIIYPREKRQKRGAECRFEWKLSRSLEAVQNTVRILLSRNFIVAGDVKREDVAAAPFVREKLERQTFRFGKSSCKVQDLVSKSCKNSSKCKVNKKCYGGRIRDADIYAVLPTGSLQKDEEPEFRKTLERHSINAKEIADEIAMPYQVGRSGVLNTLNPHREASSVLTLWVVAIGSFGTAIITFLERRRHVGKEIVRSRHMVSRRLLLPMLGFLVLIMIEGVALLIGMLIEKSIKNWRGIDLMFMLKTAKESDAEKLAITKVENGENDLFFTITLFAAKYSKVHTLYYEYLAVLVLYLVVLGGAAIFVIWTAERRRRVTRRNGYEEYDEKFAPHFHRGPYEVEAWNKMPYSDIASDSEQRSRSPR